MLANTAQTLQLARETLDIEAAALLQLKARLDERFVKAVNMVLGVQGRVVVTGMGKSGHVGRKIAATLASTGSPAFFVHPGQRIKMIRHQGCRDSAPRAGCDEQGAP